MFCNVLRKSKKLSSTSMNWRAFCLEQVLGSLVLPSLFAEGYMPDQKKIQKAVEAIKSGESLRAAAREAGLPESTLRTLLKRTKKQTTFQEQNAKQRIASLEAELKKTRANLANRWGLVDEVKASLANDPTVHVRTNQPRVITPDQIKKSKTPVTAVMIVGDWHIGAQVDPVQVEGFNAYNWEITQERINEFVNSFLAWVNVQRASYPIDKCVVFDVADMISGMIHEELLMTNEFPVPTQVALAGRALGSLLVTLANQFDEMEFQGVGADNHSRLFKKPIAKDKTTWSLASLIHEIAATLVRDIPNVKFITSPATRRVVTLSGWNFMVEHGDAVKAHMGIPWWSVQRLQGREAIRRMGHPELEFDYHIFGHWHTPFFGERIICNGSLMGTSEYDHQFGRMSPPSQTGFLLHPRKGVFNYVPFTLGQG